MSGPSFSTNWYPEQQLRQLQGLARVVTATGAYVEIGCYEGRSTIALAAAIAPQPLHAIDHFRGDTDNPAAIAGREGINPAALVGCDLYGRFVANLRLAGVRNIVTHNADWRVGLAAIAGPLAFVHLDGSHDYASVAAQLAAVLGRMASDGLAVVCGDDWTAPGVARAVQDAIGAYHHSGNFWWSFW